MSVNRDSDLLGHSTVFPSASVGKVSALVSRYALQSMARELLLGVNNKRGNVYRVVDCKRQVAPEWKVGDNGKRYAVARTKVQILGSKASRAAMFSGLATCGLVWVCPVCACRISEIRAADLGKIASHPEYISSMLTLTLRHSLHQPLEVVLSALLDSFNRFKSGRAWVRLCDQFSIVGTVKALEVLWNRRNGWHCHLHVLLVCPRAGLSDADFSLTVAYDLETECKRRWLHVLSAVGFEASYQHGAKITTSWDEIQDYISKFGHDPQREITVEREVSKSVSKRVAGKGGLSPWALLYDAFNAPTAYARRRAAALWMEYVKAFEGRHQLDPSESLYDIFGLQHVSDLKAAQSFPDDFVLLASLSWGQWRIILQNDLRAQLLEVAASGDSDILAAWLRRVPGMPNMVRVNLDDYMQGRPYVHEIGFLD